MNTILRIRYVTILAVLAALLAAILMFVIGAADTFEAYKVFLRMEDPGLAGDPNLDATVKVLKALDSFLFGLVLLFFAYSVFFLFVREDTSGARVRVPEWLQVQDLEHMKKTMLEVIIVLLAVLFLITGLENQYPGRAELEPRTDPGGHPGDRRRRQADEISDVESPSLERRGVGPWLSYPALSSLKPRPEDAQVRSGGGPHVRHRQRTPRAWPMPCSLPSIQSRVSTRSWWPCP